MFQQTIRKALKDYSKIIERSLPSEAVAEKLCALKIRSSDLRRVSDVALYQKGCAVMADIERQMHPCGKHSFVCSNLNEFYDHFKGLMSHYLLYRGAVVHGPQMAARSLVRAIQLLRFPTEKRTLAVAREINQCRSLLMRFGTASQKKIFFDALKKQVT